ncbi:hypothetical protein BJV82DRAFT_505794 [Fennellomyces sp. T-0311]|nr:hypothetical protein BJV82DRAFT_505794 [Fennellomyces sp. T-0311]
MPMATVYIVARALLDCSRNVIYYTLWFLERSTPVIDAWLFHKVTVWLPAKYEQCERWWATRGVHAWHKTQNYAVNTVVPTTVHCLDQFFVGVGHTYRSLHKISIQFGVAWRRFAQKHDWKQLASDMVDLWTAVVWQPTVWIVSRTYRLGAMLYYGSRNVIRSLKEDVRWVFAVALPTVWHMIATTRIFDWTYHGALWVNARTKWGVAKMLEHVVLPLLQSLRRGTITSIDFIASVINSPGFQKRLHAARVVVMSSTVWMVQDQITFLTDNVELFLGVVVPCANWFMNEVVPRLSAAYHRLTMILWRSYQRHLRPALVTAYCLVQPFALAIYTHLSGAISVPFVKMWALAQTIGTAAWDYAQLYGQHTLSTAFQLARQSGTRAWILSKQLYTHLSLWLEQQAPSLLSAFNTAWELAVSHGFNLMHVDATAMKEWVSNVAELTFESLERILSEWIKEQSQGGYDAAKEKVQ